MINNIEQENITKLLGTFLDEDISRKPHIDMICSITSKSNGILYNPRQMLSKNLLKQLYYSFINGYLIYANLVWGSNHKSKLEPLYYHQKRAARAIIL